MLLQIRQHVDEDLAQAQDHTGTARRFGQIDADLQHLGGLQEPPRGTQGSGERPEDIQGPGSQTGGEEKVGGLPVLDDGLISLFVVPGEPAERLAGLDDRGQRRRVAPAHERIQLARRRVDITDTGVNESGEIVDSVAPIPIGVLADAGQTVGDDPHGLDDRQCGLGADHLHASAGLPVKRGEDLPQRVGVGRASALGRLG